MTVLILALSFAVVALAVTAWRLARAEQRRSEARIEALAAAVDGTDAAPADRQPVFGFSGNGMSEFASERVPVPRFPVLAAAGGLILMVVAAGWLTLGGGAGERRAPAVSKATAGPAIELLSMRHSIDGRSLVVSGLVRNRAGRSTPALTAVVTALGHDGDVVARGESRLDPAVLQPGKETSFRVVMPDVNDPGRYRVGFASSGQLVPHLDRRGDLRQASLSAARRN